MYIHMYLSLSIYIYIYIYMYTCAYNICSRHTLYTHTHVHA